MIGRRSISARLTIWFSSIFFLGLLVFGTAMWIDLSRSLDAGRSKTLNGRADRIIEFLESSRGESPQARAKEFHDLTHLIPEGGLIRVFDANGTLVYPDASTLSVPFPWPKLQKINRNEFNEVEVSGTPYRVLARSFQVESEPLFICVAGQLVDNRLLLRRFAWGLLMTTPLLLILSALGGYLLSQRALEPVDRITASARSISIGNISERLPVSETGDEIQRLAETCNDMLERLDLAVDQIKQFTADASHELRSPVSFVRTVAEAALRNPDVDPESRRAFQDIVAECDKTARLLADMLTLARADAGNDKTVFEPIDLSELVREICEKIRPAAESKQQALSVCISDRDPIEVLGDYPQLRRLVCILLDNAVKYTPAHGKIEATLHAADGHARVAIKDNGIGIPAADLPHIFQRFYRVDPSRSQVDGTGLGLAIAKLISDIHQTTLSVESRENIGSVFEVAFPLVR